MGTKLQSVVFQKAVRFNDATGKRHAGDHFSVDEDGFELEAHESARLVTITHKGRLVHRVPFENVVGDTPMSEGLDKVHHAVDFSEASDRHPLTGLTLEQARAQSEAATMNRLAKEAAEAEAAVMDDPETLSEMLSDEDPLAPTPEELAKAPADAPTQDDTTGKELSPEDQAKLEKILDQVVDIQEAAKQVGHLVPPTCGKPVGKKTCGLPPEHKGSCKGPGKKAS